MKAAAWKMKRGQHLPPPARVLRIAGRVPVVAAKVAKMDNPSATKAANLLGKAHALMMEAAALLGAKKLSSAKTAQGSRS